MADPNRRIELFFVSSWSEHERQHVRVSNEDAQIQTQIAGLNRSADLPRASHWLVDA